MENFLSATIDARLVAAEIDLQDEVDQIPLNVLDGVLAKYLGVLESNIVRDRDASGRDFVKINVEPRFATNPVIFEGDSSDPSSCAMKDPLAVKKEHFEDEDEDEKAFETLPFVEAHQDICIKLEPP